eukprot:Gb_37780 [translate_table: standard]
MLMGDDKSESSMGSRDRELLIPVAEGVEDGDIKSSSSPSSSSYHSGREVRYIQSTVGSGRSGFGLAVDICQTGRTGASFTSELGFNHMLTLQIMEGDDRRLAYHGFLLFQFYWNAHVLFSALVNFKVRLKLDNAFLVLVTYIIVFVKVLNSYVDLRGVAVTPLSWNLGVCLVVKSKAQYSRFWSPLASKKSDSKFHSKDYVHLPRKGQKLQYLNRTGEKKAAI